MNKDTFQIIFTVAILAYAGFRLYTKYFKKDGDTSGHNQKDSSQLHSSSKDDDYEPYSKK